MAWLFSLTLFLSAFLLFLVQPLVGRILLPKLGGAPAVWNSCMLFFQAALLAGYAYSHALTARLRGRRQIALHVILLLFPLAVLPIAISDDAFRTSAAIDRPVLLTLRLLIVAVGLPFFVVSTTAPLLQRWFSNTEHSSARDPYFLYAASNAGSILALLAYPILVEPFLPLRSQSLLWSWGYAVYAALVLLCGLALWRTRKIPTRSKATVVLTNPKSDQAAQAQPPLPPLTKRGKGELSLSENAASAEQLTSQLPAALPWRRRLRWLFLAFVPSSLLLGVTNYISTDIAPIPLLWVIPLALYLLSFTLVFARRPPIPHWVIGRLFPVFVLMLTLVLLMGATSIRGMPPGPLLALHVFVFFLAAMAGHGELAQDRPDAVHLTEFYLWLAFGGVLGGVFNTLVAPIIFHRLGLIEYPLAIVLACFLMRKESRPASPRQFARDIVEPVVLASITVNLILLVAAFTPRSVDLRHRIEDRPKWDYLGQFVDLSPGPLRTALTFGVPCVLLYLFVDRPRRFGLGVGAVLLAGAVNADFIWPHIERNFFGVVKVDVTKGQNGERYRVLYHGNTIHGQQRLGQLDAEGRHEPLTYYHRTGPIGVFCKTWFKARPARQQVACVGLGVGSLAYYARAGDRWTFYEIDPTIKRLAEDPNYFSFLKECRAGKPDIILGDARLKMLDAPDRVYDLIVLDAFSSDAIPMHLLTREAFQIYVRKLREHGVIAMHVSNRYLNLWPIVARLAQDAELTVRGFDDQYTYQEIHPGKSNSEWLILARDAADFGEVIRLPGKRKLPDPRWVRVEPNENTPLWTDDFSNLLSAFGGWDRD